MRGVGRGHLDQPDIHMSGPPSVAPSSAAGSGPNSPVAVRLEWAEATHAHQPARSGRAHRGWFHRLMIWLATHPIERNRMPW